MNYLEFLFLSLRETSRLFYFVLVQLKLVARAPFLLGKPLKVCDLLLSSL